MSLTTKAAARDGWTEPQCGQTPRSARVPLDPLFDREIKLLDNWDGPTGASAAVNDSGRCPAMGKTKWHCVSYLAVNNSQTAKPIAAGRKISAQSCHRVAQRPSVRDSFRASLRNELVNRERRLDGKPRMARTISSLPLRSAIRMVAELIPLVDCSSFLRSGGGTSSTERYTSVLLPTEMKMVELFKVTRDIMSTAFARGLRPPHALILPE